MTENFDVITVDDQMIEDIFSLDKKLRYYGFRPVGVIVSYLALFPAHTSCLLRPLLDG